MGLFDTVRTAFAGGPQPVVHQQGNAAPGVNQQQPQPQPNPNDRVPQNNPGGDPNNGVPPNNSSQPTKDPIISQLDQFGDLWKTPAVDPKAPVDPLTQPLLSYDPAKFATEARKMNFTQGLDPALITKALGGDAQALMDVINHSTQNAFISASQLSTNLVEGAAKTNNSRLEPRFEKQFKEFMLTQSRTEDPVMQHPAVAPMLDLAKRQLLSQHPDWNAQQVHQAAEQYVTEFATAFTGNKNRKAEQVNSNVDDPQDFSKWGT